MTINKQFSIGQLAPLPEQGTTHNHAQDGDCTAIALGHSSELHVSITI